VSKFQICLKIPGGTAGSLDFSFFYANIMYRFMSDSVWCLAGALLEVRKGEGRAPKTLSFVAKPLLAWQVFSGAIIPALSNN